MNKLIYILLATYNGEKYIEEQLDSLISQTYQNWQLIIHDDNSNDETINIIRKYLKMHPNKIKYIDDDIGTGGSKENFSFLIENIDDNYDYIMFCDQDDVWLDNKIELTLNEILKIEKLNPDKPILIHTDLRVVDNGLKTISDSMFVYQKIKPEWSKLFEVSLVQNTVTGCTMMINKKAKELSIPISNNAIMHDWWILLIVLKYSGVVQFINDQTILYRQHNANDVGAQKFSIKALFYKLNVLNKYQLMAKDLGLELSLVKLVWLKLVIILKRIFNA